MKKAIAPTTRALWGVLALVRYKLTTANNALVLDAARHDAAVQEAEIGHLQTYNVPENQGPKCPVLS